MLNLQTNMNFETASSITLASFLLGEAPTSFSEVAYLFSEAASYVCESKIKFQASISIMSTMSCLPSPCLGSNKERTAIVRKVYKDGN